LASWWESALSVFESEEVGRIEMASGQPVRDEAEAFGIELEAGTLRVLLQLVEPTSGAAA